MWCTRLDVTAKASPRERNNLRNISGHKFPTVGAAFQPKMVPQALDPITKALGLQSADSAGAGSTKY